MSVVPQEMEDCIKESIDTNPLESKLLASEAEQRRLQSELNQHILATQSAKAEAKLNAQGLKKAIERNERLTQDNSRLLEQYKNSKAFVNKWKLALDRAKEGEIRVRHLENELKGLTEDLDFFKDQYQMHKFSFSTMEEVLVESVLTDLIGQTESSVAEFLVQNMGHESCRRLIHLSNSLRPSTLRALSLAAKVKALQNQNQQLQILLSTSQGEAKLLTDQIGYLIEDRTTSYDGEDVSGKRQGHYSRGKPPASKFSPKLHQSTKRSWEPSDLED